VPPIVIPKSFRKRLEKKTPPMQAAILECVKRLGDDTRHPGLQTHRVQGEPGVFEAYVDAANRVTFEYEGSRIKLRNNCNHDIINRRP